MIDLHPSGGLPIEVGTLLAEYLRLVDAAVPGKIGGLYLTGSIALGDYLPGVSDVDFVALSSSDFHAAELLALEQVHHKLNTRGDFPRLDGIYTTWQHLALPASSAPVHHWLDGKLHHKSRSAANPVTWATLHRHPVTVRGAPAPVVSYDEQELKEWCLANLDAYWLKWMASSRWKGSRFLSSFSLEATVWGVLGVIRLHATITSAAIISKTQAQAYAKVAFPPRWESIVNVALSGRRHVRGASTLGRLSRRKQALEFMQFVIDDAKESASFARGTPKSKLV